MRELENIEALRAALVDARQYTLSAYGHLDEARRELPRLDIVNPPRWELAHVAWFQEYWCLRGGGADPRTRLPGADAMLDSSRVPHDSRWQLPLPDYAGCLRYLDAVLADTLAALERSDGGGRYFFKLALYHEDMHLEALLMTLHTLGLPAPDFVREVSPPPVPRAPAQGDVAFAGGEFELGTPPGGADFAFDNEKRAHPVRLAPFAMARTATCNGAYRAFVEDGGYSRREFWTEQGWAWKRSRGLDAPRDWRRDGGSWQQRRFDAWQPLDDDAPVIHVSLHEARAWCRWAGRRLPTEAEWEFACRAGLAADADRRPWGAAAGALPANLDHRHGAPLAVDALPAGDTPAGLRQMLGNVWEWTDSAFLPYPGFSPDPYRDYSAPWFGDHQVIRGGSFATRSRLVHSRFRNFYRPGRNDPFVGFRSCALEV